MPGCAEHSEEEDGMADKEKAGRDGVKVSPDCGKRKEGSAGGRPEDALGRV